MKTLLVNGYHELHAGCRMLAAACWLGRLIIFSPIANPEPSPHRPAGGHCQPQGRARQAQDREPGGGEAQGIGHPCNHFKTESFTLFVLRVDILGSKCFVHLKIYN